MLKIGEFSKLSRVSIRMLRHYDEIGLLKPAQTDSLTDYRYYRADQLPTVCRIAALKDMGIAPTKENVDDYLSALREYLEEDRPNAEEVRFCAIPSRC